MMEHKAFLFDHASFEQGLRPILEDALSSGDTTALQAFIRTNLDALRHPDSGEPLGIEWASHLDLDDAHQCGDLALTKYYDPTDDIGLGAEWERVQAAIIELSRDEPPILGGVVGPSSAPFDPGKMGSYFQSATRVRENFERIRELVRDARSAALNRATSMLETAARADHGLYVTF